MDEQVRLAALATLQATPGLLRTALEAWPRALLEQPADGDWSPKDVAVHLEISEERGALGRLRRVVEEDFPLLPVYDERVELERSPLRAASLEEVLDAFEQARLADVDWLRSLAFEVFARTGNHAEVGTLTGEHLLAQAAYHDHLHLAQLARMLHAPFEGLRGPLSIY